MSEIRRQYDPEFKAGAVRIVCETRRPVAEIARELGIVAARWAIGSAKTASNAAMPKL